MRWVITLLICTCSVSGTLGLQRLAPEVLGKVCAFADFNSDKNTDFVISRNGNLTILLQETKLLDVLEAPKLIEMATWQVSENDVSSDVECSVADFNGDARLDVLVSIRLGDKKYNHTLWTSVVDLNGRESFEAFNVGILLQHAMTVDVTNDGMSDIIGFFPNGSFYCSKVNAMGHIGITDDCRSDFAHFPEKTNVYEGMPHLFFDMNSDLRADLVFMTKDDDGSLVMECWQQQKIGWVYKTWIPKLSSAQYPYLAAPVVMDHDGDGEMDLLVPVCRQPDCRHVTSFAIFSIKHGWRNSAFDVQDFELLGEPNSRVLFRVGDWSLDGFPDMIVLVKDPKEVNETRKAKVHPHAKIVENLDCKNCEKNNTRKFEMKKMELVTPKNLTLGIPKMVTFFDLLEDGSLDILVEFEYNNEVRTGFIYCRDKGDTTFLKVQVFTGICDDQCDPKSTELGSGNSMAGACVSYSRIDGWGGNAQSTSCQDPSSMYRSLNPPYVLFGLGRSPNFVDELNVAIPKYADRKEDWKHTLKQIVPNSRIIIVPPSAHSAHWSSRLYVTPSTLIAQSTFVIATVCAMLFLVVAFLHYREKKEDRYERQQQSHRFHFDAM